VTVNMVINETRIYHFDGCRTIVHKFGGFGKIILSWLALIHLKFILKKLPSDSLFKHSRLWIIFDDRNLLLLTFNYKSLIDTDVRILPQKLLFISKILSRPLTLLFELFLLVLA